MNQYYIRQSQPCQWTILHGSTDELGSLAIFEKTFDPDHPSVATCLENLSLLYRATGRDAEAKQLEQRAAKIRAIKR